MDSKYANLPGIARNEPDHYETSDLTVIEQKAVEDDSANVQKINVSTKEAHERFNKNQLNSQNVDFSDNLTGRRKFGYIVEKDAYEWDALAQESPLQKFNRLQRELDELKNELNDYSADNKANNETNVDFDPLNLSQQVEKLRKQAKNLHLEVIGANYDVNKVDGKVKKQLLIDHFNDLKKSLSTIDKSTNKKQAEDHKAPISIEHDNSIVFKLFNDLDSSTLNRTIKLSDLSQRLSRLELILGSNESTLNSLCSNIDNKSVFGLIEHLNTKISLIDPQSTEVIESRLQLITQKITQLNEKKVVIDDHEKLNKIGELFNMISKWKELSLNLPNVINRLTALNDLHQQAFQFSSALSRLDSEQQLMRQTLDTNSDTLTQLKVNLEKNLESIKNNFDTLNNRILSINVQTNA